MIISKKMKYSIILLIILTLSITLVLSDNIGKYDVTDDGAVKLDDVALASNCIGEIIEGKCIKTDVTGDDITDIQDVIEVNKNRQDSLYTANQPPKIITFDVTKKKDILEIYVISNDDLLIKSLSLDSPLNYEIDCESQKSCERTFNIPYFLAENSDDIKETSIEEKNNKKYYKAIISKKAKLFGFIPLEKEVIIEFSEEGETLNTDEPFWSFLTTDVEEESNEEDIIVTVTVTDVEGLTATKSYLGPKSAKQITVDFNNNQGEIKNILGVNGGPVAPTNFLWDAGEIIDPMTNLKFL